MRGTVAVSSTETGLAKVMVAAPKRRLEVAVPEHLPVAVLLLTLLLIPVTVLMAGGHWIGPAIASLALSVLLTAAGIALSRALSDSVAGAVVGALALPYGLLGGFLLLGGNLPLLQFGAPQLLVGSTTMLVLAVIGYFGVADLRRLFVGGIVAGLAGAI